jgi:hypothetical protein
MSSTQVAGYRTHEEVARLLSERGSDAATTRVIHEEVNPAKTRHGHADGPRADVWIRAVTLDERNAIAVSELLCNDAFGVGNAGLVEVHSDHAPHLPAVSQQVKAEPRPMPCAPPVTTAALVHSMASTYQIDEPHAAKGGQWVAADRRVCELPAQHHPPLLPR